MSWKSWRPYAVGSVVKEAGIKILEIVQSHRLQSQMMYKIEYLCCGAQEEIDHHRIYDRKTKESVNCKHCRKCAKRDRFGHVRIGIKGPCPQPEWLPPQSTIKDAHWIWEDNGEMQNLWAQWCKSKGLA